MIGLGSNRLSVCRRGGMSVTQAGRGGMEWLAGGRVPSWGSPYSAQATAALKAQFPTQWPTIRDYGSRHPEIVPYVNEYPVGWGNIIVSYQLCEYIASTGTQYIDLGFKPTVKTIWSVDARVTESSQVQQQFGTDENTTSSMLVLYFGTSNNTIGSYIRYQGISKVLTNNQPLIRHKFIFDNVRRKIAVDDIEDSFSLTPQNINNNIYLFIRNSGNILEYPCNMAIYGTTIIDDSVCVKSLFPCYNKESGVIGMYDVVNCEFRTNAGTGTFLKGSDIYYPGQTPAS